MKKQYIVLVVLIVACVGAASMLRQRRSYNMYALTADEQLRSVVGIETDVLSIVDASLLPIPIQCDNFAFNGKVYIRKNRDDQNNQNEVVAFSPPFHDDWRYTQCIQQDGTIRVLSIAELVALCGS